MSKEKKSRQPALLDDPFRSHLHAATLRRTSSCFSASFSSASSVLLGAVLPAPPSAPGHRGLQRHRRACPPTMRHHSADAVTLGLTSARLCAGVSPFFD